jgi:hypothetical protein
VGDPVGSAVQLLVIQVFSAESQGDGQRLGPNNLLEEFMERLSRDFIEDSSPRSVHQERPFGDAPPVAGKRLV